MNLKNFATVAALLICVMVLGVAAPAAAETPGAPAPMERPHPAHYLVLDVDTDSGAATVVSYQRVALSAPLTSLSEGDLRSAEATSLTDALSVRLTGADGEVVFRDVVRPDRWLRGEFEGDAETGEIVGHHIPMESSAVVVRVPVIPGAETLTLSDTSAARGASTVLDLSALADEFGSAPRQPTPDASAAYLPGWDNGDPANRVDIVIIGDGYTAAEQAAFEADAAALAASFFNEDDAPNTSPYHEYANYVNVATAFVPSNESGADQPPYQDGCTATGSAGNPAACCPDSGAIGEGSALVDTAFDATYCTQRIQRLLTVDAWAVFDALGMLFPDYDEAIVIVNDTTYGGAGGPISVISTDASAVWVAQHEYGHTFVGLADEYTTPYPGYPLCSDVDSGLPNCEGNVTDETVRENIKWNEWIDPGQPVPSIAPPTNPVAAGLWEGARYLSQNMYRQGYGCIMNYFGAGFCQVDAEQYALQFYGAAAVDMGYRISMIEPGTPTPAQNATIPIGELTTFSAEILAPVNSTPPTVEWYVDGVLSFSSDTLTTGSQPSFDFTATEASTTEIMLVVTDNSPLINDANRDQAVSTYTWTVTAGDGGDGDDGDDGGGGTNLLANAGFEAAMGSEWTQVFSGGGDGRLPYPGSYEGSALMLFQGNNGLELILQEVPYSGALGDTFTLTFQLGGINVADGGVIASRLMLFSGGQPVQAPAFCFYSQRGTFPWGEVTCSITAEAAFDTVTVGVGWLDVPSGLLGVDDMTLTD